ncbi:reverse transcriptase [Gossypium australe]|uniref:Reverse transcriptase n=1 Tax=Gossypium australe TaxID=47621 RepID=A0A5B6VZ50_9ROSI|nr:reverse transcriptase [Gossypium australe]
MVRRHRNLLTSLLVKGNWVVDQDVLRRHAIEFFSILFCRRSYESLKATYDVFSLKLSGEEIASVTHDLEVVEKALKVGEVDLDVLKAHMLLILKGSRPTIVKDFRPITLLNTSYKILSKVIVNCLRPILQRIIEPYQNSFLAGHCTTDNTLIAQEVVHSLMGKKGRQGPMVCKIDLHKAYNSVLEFCQRSVTYGMVIRYQLLSLKRGLERLSHMILKKVKRRLWQPVKTSRLGPVSPNSPLARAVCISLLCGIPLISELGTYLIVPIIYGRVTKVIYSHIVDKVTNKLCNWRGKVLSYAGRRTLIQSTLSSITTYTMQTTMLPVSICEHLDQCNRKFL